jgi:hypothetical protein
MEAGKLLSYLFLTLISIVAMIVYISITRQISSECKLEITGAKLTVLSELENCVRLCWSKHNFGGDVFSDDCFIVTVNSSSLISKDEMENFFKSMTKIYFDSLDQNKAYKIKIRYNSTGKEISLMIFEKLQ